MAPFFYCNFKKNDNRSMMLDQFHFSTKTLKYFGMQLDTETSLQSMYDHYYNGDGRLLRKREITAIQTLEHIKCIAGKHNFQRVIDVGAGEGSLLDQLSHDEFAEELHGVEISSSAISIINQKNIKRLTAIKSFDGYCIPYKDNYFDAAISIHVLEHVEHERAFLHELKRISKHILIEVPLEHTFQINRAIDLCRPHGHINFYTTETFKNLLETSGLKCIDMQIFPVSKELEVFISGHVKGTAKNFLRSTTLSTLPQLATSMMNYMCIAHCLAE